MVTAGQWLIVFVLAEAPPAQPPAAGSGEYKSVVQSRVRNVNLLLGHSPNYGRPKLAACGGHHQQSASVATIDCRLAADAALLADPHIITHI